MKEYIILISVLVLTFTPNYFFRQFLKNSGEELIRIAMDLKDNLEQGEELKEEDAQKLREAFLEREKIWILIVDHDMLDEIENEIHECVAFYEHESRKDFISSYSKVKDAIEDLAKREEISLANIL